MKKASLVALLLVVVVALASASTPCPDSPPGTHNLCEECLDYCLTRYDACVAHRISTGLPLLCEEKLSLCQWGC